MISFSALTLIVLALFLVIFLVGVTTLAMLAASRGRTVTVREDRRNRH